jgi:hypothetical protein
MKQKSYFLMSFAFLMGGWLDSTALSNIARSPQSSRLESTSTQAAKDKLTIEISGASLSINGKDVPLPIDTEKLFELLGRPDRVSPLYNTIYTWDEKGVFAYERPDGVQVFQISIAIGSIKFEYWPSQAFSGVLTIDGARITSQSDPVEINRIKTGKKFGQVFPLMFWWRISYEDRYISMHRGASGTYEISGQIVEVGIEIIRK